MVSRGYKTGILSTTGWGLNVFTEDDLDKIHKASLEIFQEIGIKVENEEAANIFHSNGCKVDKKEDSWIVKIPSYIVEDCIRSTPHNVVLKGRDPDYDYSVDANCVSFTTFGECINIIDLETKRLRKTCQTDSAEIARLCDSFDDIKIVHRPVASLDKPLGTHPIFDAEALFGNTGKHINLGPVTGKNFKTIAKIAGAHLNGVDNFAERPMFTTIICPSSPLRLEKNCADMVIESAKLNGGGIITIPVALAGATNPITLGGTLVNHNVEALSALILAQLIRKGTRVIFGAVSTIMDMKMGTAPFGAPEMGMISSAIAKMAQYYQLPSLVSGSHSDSKALDAQIGYESAIGALTCAFAGANFIYGLGTLEDALTFDYAKFMMDLEMSRMITHVIKGISLDDTQLAIDATREVGPGGEFLTAEHTLEHMREHFQASLFDRRSRQEWEKLKVKSLNERSYEAAKQRLASHEPKVVSEDTQLEIKEIINEYLSKEGITDN